MFTQNFVFLQVKAFGSLVKGLRIGMDLLLLLQKEGFMTSSLAKVLCLPLLIGNDGLDKFLAQFEAAIDSDFPNYQVTTFFKSFDHLTCHELCCLLSIDLCCIFLFATL